MPPHGAIAIVAAVAFLQPGPAALRGIFEEGLARRRAEYGVFDTRTAQAARDLGMFLSRHGEEADARNILDQVVRIDEKLFGPDAPRTLADVAELAAVSPAGQAEPLVEARIGNGGRRAWRRGRWRNWANYARSRTIEPGRRRFTEGHSQRTKRLSGKSSAGVALDLNALAKVVDAAEAVPLLERALAIDRRVLGPRHAETATTEANLAGLLADTPRNEEAIRLATEALAVFRKTVGPDHPRTAVAASILGYAYEVKGDRRQAEQMYRLALSIDGRVYGPQHPQTLNDARVLAEFLKTTPAGR